MNTIENHKNITINPQYDNLLPKLTSEQYDALKKSIHTEGQHYPIAYNIKNEILDGHHRYKICAELGLAPKFEDQPRIFDSDLAERQFVLETNLLRRHLDTWNRIIVAKPLLEIYKEKAQQRQGQRTDLNLPQNFVESNDKRDGEAIVQFAQAVHSNPETVRQALFIEEKARPEIKEKLANQELTINAAYVQTKSDEKRKQIPINPPPLPEGKYRCIIIDPPWEMEKIEREERPNQTNTLDYPCMSLEEIAKLPITELADAEGCHIYLWVTHKHLPDGLNLFEKWGVKYQCVLTWVKNVGFTPFSWMYNTEHVLFGRIGKLQLTKLGDKLSFESPVTKHSEKPEAFYIKVKAASPEPRIAMFERKPRDGFTVWGNEI